MKFGPMLAALAAALLAILSLLEVTSGRRRSTEAPGAHGDHITGGAPQTFFMVEQRARGGQSTAVAAHFVFGNWGQEMVAQLNEPSMRDVVQGLQDPPNPRSRGLVSCRLQQTDGYDHKRHYADRSRGSEMLKIWYFVLTCEDGTQVFMCELPTAIRK